MRKRGGNTNKGPAHNRYVHGMAGTPTYKSWQEMKTRCLNPRNSNYPNWGGRGIVICDRWMSFKNFLKDMGVKPPGKTIERIDNDGNYEPSNCVWADRTTQSRNRSYTKLTTEKASSIRSERENGATLITLSEKYGVSVSHVHRIVHGESWV